MVTDAYGIILQDTRGHKTDERYSNYLLESLHGDNPLCDSSLGFTKFPQVDGGRVSLKLSKLPPETCRVDGSRVPSCTDSMLSNKNWWTLNASLQAKDRRRVSDAGTSFELSCSQNSDQSTIYRSDRLSQSARLCVVANEDFDSNVPAHSFDKYEEKFHLDYEKRGLNLSRTVAGSASHRRLGLARIPRWVYRKLRASELSFKFPSHGKNSIQQKVLETDTKSPLAVDDSTDNIEIIPQTEVDGKSIKRSKTCKLYASVSKSVVVHLQHWFKQILFKKNPLFQNHKKFNESEQSHYEKHLYSTYHPPKESPSVGQLSSTREEDRGSEASSLKCSPIPVLKYRELVQKISLFLGGMDEGEGAVSRSEDIFTLNNFLTRQRTKIDIDTVRSGGNSSRVNIFLSEPDPSFSSMVAVICYAWLLDLSATAEGHMHIPVINISRSNMWEYKEEAWLFHHFGLDAKALLFSDEVDLESLFHACQLSIVVVGQDALKNDDEVASICTLAVEEYLTHDVNLSQHATVKELLLAGILLDTNDMDPTAVFITSRDQEAVEFLLVDTHQNQGSRLFSMLDQEDSFAEEMRRNYGEPTDHPGDL